MSNPRLALALDTYDMSEAITSAEKMRPYFDVAKIGLELFYFCGLAALNSIKDLGYEIFLDLKMFDIPHTVRQGAKALGARGVDYVTIHAQGGKAMLRAGVEGLAESNPDAKVLAVTGLTSDTYVSKDDMYLHSTIAVETGCYGVICPATHADQVRSVSEELFIASPGIRFKENLWHDHTKVATPRQAVILYDVDMLIVGRPVTDASDQEAAAKRLVEEVKEAHKCT